MLAVVNGIFSNLKIFHQRNMFGISIGVRSFSTHGSLLARNTNDKFYKILKYVKPVETRTFQAGEEIPKGVRIPAQPAQYPPYAYETMFFKRQNRGLYGGVQRKRSKTCSEAGNKNLRVHLPNIQKSKLWSETLGKVIQTRVSTKVLKTITKEGGLDNYLTKDKPARVKTLGLKGWQLRYDVLKAKEHKGMQDPTINQTTYHILGNGKRVIVGKQKLLKELYELMNRDSYTPIEPHVFRRNHSYMNIGEIVEALESRGFDFTKVTV